MSLYRDFKLRLFSTMIMNYLFAFWIKLAKHGPAAEVMPVLMPL